MWVDIAGPLIAFLVAVGGLFNFSVISPLNKTIQQLSEAIEDMRKTIHDMDEKRQSMEKTIARLEATVEHQEGWIKEIARRVDDHE